ncbi:MAG: transporter [Elusimicrobia bacterium]|nr:transporter [Candidatus Liberimonas magnetica]
MNFKVLFYILLSFMLFLPGLSQARINIFDPWHPGQDSAIGDVNSYQSVFTFKSGTNFFELPVHFTYIATDKTEAGGAWGIKSAGGKTGINDLQLGIKYQLMDGLGNKPAVLGEIAASLPTADSTRELGLGSAGFYVHWALEKKFENIVGYFGLGLGIFGENSDKVKQGNIFMYHIGTSFPYKNKYRLHTELKGYNHSNTKINGVEFLDSYQEMYFAPGVNYFWKKKHTLSASLLIGLTSKSNDLGLFLACNF